MPPTVVLVTGVAQRLAGRVAARLAEAPGIERVIGVDTSPPEHAEAATLERVEFVRADIRNPLIAKVVGGAQVDTVVHMDLTATPMGAGGRASMKEMNVIGTMQLLAACQKAPGMRRLVLRSTAAVYGSSPRDPALFTEDTEPRSLPRSGYAKDAVEVEGYVRGFHRRRPDVAVLILRPANVIGPHVDSPLARYFALPVVPTFLGYDPRLQFLHEQDAVEVLVRAAIGEDEGVVNVAGRGVLLLSQAIRRAGRLPLPVPSLAVGALGRMARQSGLVDFSPEQLQFLHYGRVIDIGRLEAEFGYQPRYSTAQAYEDFVRGTNLTSPLNPATVGALEEALLDRLRPTQHLNREPADA